MGRPLDDVDVGPARLLATLGLLTEQADGFTPTPGMAALFTTVPASTRAAAITSTLRQIAAVTGIVARVAGDGWSTFDDETLRAQGNVSALGGQMLATVVVGTLPGLAERFRTGGRLLDVGTGVGAGPAPPSPRHCPTQRSWASTSSPGLSTWPAPSSRNGVSTTVSRSVIKASKT